MKVWKKVSFEAFQVYFRIFFTAINHNLSLFYSNFNNVKQFNYQNNIFMFNSLCTIDYYFCPYFIIFSSLLYYFHFSIIFLFLQISISYCIIIFPPCVIIFSLTTPLSPNFTHLSLFYLHFYISLLNYYISLCEYNSTYRIIIFLSLYYFYKWF